jgi:hypothetical protein
LPAALVAQPGDAVLRIRYEGDVAQLYAGNRLLTDNYYKGTPFAWPLARLTADERKAGLTLRILPLRRDAPIYLMHDAWPDFHADLQIGRLLSATIETGVTVELAPAAK